MIKMNNKIKRIRELRIQMNKLNYEQKHHCWIMMTCMQCRDNHSVFAFNLRSGKCPAGHVVKESK